MIHGDLFEGKRFLVVGGAGFIGSHIAERLLLLGSHVTVVDDFSNGKASNLATENPHLSLSQGDVRTFDFGQLGKFDGIFNEAARALVPSFADPMTDLAVNAGGVTRILEFARRSDAKVVHASSGSVYGNPVRIPMGEGHPLRPISPYGVSKLASEYYCLMFHQIYGLDVAMLRYFNVYGPRQTSSEEMGVIPVFVNKALRNEDLKIFGDGKQTRDFLNVRDVVKANLLSFGSSRVGGEAINIGGGGREISIQDLAKLVLKMCASESRVTYADPKPGDIRRLVADITCAKELIGYVPEVSLETGLQEYLGFVRKAN